MPDRHKIHLILAAYNEASVIAQVIKEINKHLTCEIIVINDGSTDDTAIIAKASGATVINHPINRGAGAACQTGITFARSQKLEKVAFMDADGQHVPTDINQLLDAMTSKSADLVIGTRFIKTDSKIPVIRHFYNILANLLTNTFCHTNYSDTQSGFRLLNRKAIESINLLQDDFSYCSEMIIQAERKGLKIIETPIKVRYSDYSVTKGQDFQVGLTTAFHLLWKLMFK